MDRILKTIVHVLKSEPTLAVLVLVLIVSFGYHAAQRTNHFQECDSSSVYYFLHSFPKAQLSYISGYNTGIFLSENTARGIINLPFVKSLIGLIS